MRIARNDEAHRSSSGGNEDNKILLIQYSQILDTINAIVPREIRMHYY